MRVAIGSDHAGYDLKRVLVKFLQAAGHSVVDLGTHSKKSVDYPDFAEAVGIAVREKRVQRGILICGSGVGASIAANKIPGVRAGLCHDTYSAHQGVEHDDMNVLTLGAWVISEKLGEELIKAFLSARFSGEPRHIRRIDKIYALAARYCGEPSRKARKEAA